MILTLRLQELMSEWDVEDEETIDDIHREKSIAYEQEVAKDDGSQVRKAAREGLALFIEDLEKMQQLRARLRATVCWFGGLTSDQARGMDRLCILMFGCLTLVPTPLQESPLSPWQLRSRKARKKSK